MKKTIWGIFVLSALTIALSACSEVEGSDTQVKAETDISEVEITQENDLIPNNAQNGTVTQDLYFELLRFKVESPAFKQELNDMVIELSNDADKMTDTTFGLKMDTHIEEYNTFLDSFKVEATTDADFELQRILNGIISNTKMSNDDINEILSSFGGSGLENFKRHISNAEEGLEELNNAMVKYEIDNAQ